MLMQFIRDLQAYYAQGGYVMPPLVAATLLLWYALGYRMSVLVRGNRRSVRVLVERYRQGYTREPRGIIDQAVVTGLAAVREQPEHARRFLDEAFAAFDGRLSAYENVVGGIVMIAPLLGLLGTVSGMIETFDSLGDMSLFSQSGGIAGGISQALFSTQLGLAVAVPGMVVGRILDRRQRSLERELAQIKDILCTDLTEPQHAL